jgi:hypothetical protein
VEYLEKARLVKLADTSDLKSDFFIKSIGSSPITSNGFPVIAKMMKLVDILGLGSSSFLKE